MRGEPTSNIGLIWTMKLKLPVYGNASDKTKQALLTPLAMVADLTIIGGVIVVYCWPAGWSFSP